MRKLGFADALGIVVALVALALMPNAADPASYPKLLVLVFGGFALAPATILRWSRFDRSRAWALVPSIAAIGLMTWTVFVTLVSDSPWQVRVFGWWLRADGLLGIIAATILLLGATTLSRSEALRTIKWIVGGAGLSALFAIPQLIGIGIFGEIEVTVSATLGQINFAGAYFAITSMLALGIAFTEAKLTWKLVNAIAALAFAALAFLTSSLQGPAALGVGIVFVFLIWALSNRGKYRRLVITITSTVTAASIGLGVLGMFALGPLAFIGREGNTTWRYAIWSAGWDTLQAHPWIGIGTGNFASYISEYRSLESTLRVGEAMRPSAVHSIPLQFGIVGGWIALVLWCILFIGAMTLLLIRVVRFPVSSPWLSAGIGGALAAYLAQAIVSIDVPSILAIGWLLAGLSVAMAREPVPASKTIQHQRKDKLSKHRNSEIQQSSRWVALGGMLLGIAGGGLVWMQINTIEQARATSDIPELVATIIDPMLPCPLRVELASTSLIGLPLSLVLPTVQNAVAIDPRCPPIMNLQTQVALEAGELKLADQSSLQGVILDPQSTSAWQLRVDYMRAVNDVSGEQDALHELERIESFATPAES